MAILTQEQGKKILFLARDAIVSYFGRKKIRIEDRVIEELKEKMPMFVIIKKKGRLRGSMGFTDARYPIYEGTAKAAVNAAFADPRFPPLEEAELDDITITVSVLTSPVLVEVRNPEEYLVKITPGKDGIMIVGTFHSGIILPETAAEHGWDTKQMLNQCCVKATIAPGSWQDFNLCRIYKFQSHIFSEVISLQL